MPQWTLRVRTGPRDPKLLPLGDDALGEAMLTRLLDVARETGPPRPALVAVHPERVEQFDLATIHKAPEPHRTRLTASILGREELDCGVVAGTLMVQRPGGAKGRGLVVFIEWPDNRWWTAWHALGPDRQPVDGEATIRRAVDGWPRPRGVGGWFARVRREGLRLRVNRPLPQVQPGLALVH